MLQGSLPGGVRNWSRGRKSNVWLLRLSKSDLLTFRRNSFPILAQLVIDFEPVMGRSRPAKIARGTRVVFKAAD
jgi:hypothetical protein